MELNWYTAVADALSEAEQATFLERFTNTNPRWRGAQVADVLEAMSDRDSNLDRVELFFEANPDLVIDGAGAVARALIWIDQPLTPEAFVELHGRAAMLVALRSAQDDVRAGKGLTPDQVRAALHRPLKGQ